MAINPAIGNMNGHTDYTANEIRVAYLQTTYMVSNDQLFNETNKTI